MGRGDRPRFPGARGDPTSPARGSPPVKTTERPAGSCASDAYELTSDGWMRAQLRRGRGPVVHAWDHGTSSKLLPRTSEQRFSLPGVPFAAPLAGRFEVEGGRSPSGGGRRSRGRRTGWPGPRHVRERRGTRPVKTGTADRTRGYRGLLRRALIVGERTMVDSYRPPAWQATLRLDRGPARVAGREGGCREPGGMAVCKCRGLPVSRLEPVIGGSAVCGGWFGAADPGPAGCWPDAPSWKRQIRPWQGGGWSPRECCQVLVGYVQDLDHRDRLAVTHRRCLVLRDHQAACTTRSTGSLSGAPPRRGGGRSLRAGWLAAENAGRAGYPGSGPAMWCCCSDPQTGRAGRARAGKTRGRPGGVLALPHREWTGERTRWTRAGWGVPAGRPPWAAAGRPTCFSRQQYVPSVDSPADKAWIHPARRSTRSRPKKPSRSPPGAVRGHPGDGWACWMGRGAGRARDDVRAAADGRHGATRQQAGGLIVGRGAAPGPDDPVTWSRLVPVGHRLKGHGRGQCAGFADHARAQR